MAHTRMWSFLAVLVFPLLFFCALSASSAVHSPPFYPDKTHLLVYRDAAGKEHAIQTAADWDKRREHILANMQLVMGPLPGISRQVPLGIYLNEEGKTDKYVRSDISFAVEEKDRLPD